MSKFEFIPEASIVRNTDPSPGQKFMDPFDAVFEAIQNSGDNPLNQKNCVKVHINHEKVYKNIDWNDLSLGPAPPASLEKMFCYAILLFSIFLPTHA